MHSIEEHVHISHKLREIRPEYSLNFPVSTHNARSLSCLANERDEHGWWISKFRSNFLIGIDVSQAISPSLIATHTATAQSHCLTLRDKVVYNSAYTLR
jgi:hypothetical protein